MIKVRKSNERGQADHGWLKSYHTFSFAEYYDPLHKQFGVLRVINEDYIEGGAGFSTHGHKDMEIITYVFEGALRHKDSMGTESVIVPGEVQRMSAGSGVLHSEYNNLPHDKTNLLQIWIRPEENGIDPSYAQKSFSDSLSKGELTLLVSKSGNAGSITINQDANMYALKTDLAGAMQFDTNTRRKTWIQIVKGSLEVEGHTLSAGDGASLEQVDKINMKWTKNTELLLIDLP